MSMMGTLAKVAAGIAVAKVAGGMMKGNSRGTSQGNGLFGGQYSNSQNSSNPMDMIGSLLGGQSGSQAAGGLGGILESLSGASGSARSGGGLNGMLGGFAQQMQGGASSSGGLGGLLSGLAGAAAATGSQSNQQDFGSIFNQALSNKGQVETQPSADQEAVAGLMLVAMIQAAKSDGKVDKSEVEKFTKNLGEIDEQEMAFIQQAMEAPVDVDSLVRQTPNGLQAQVYTMSVLGIELDNQAEAEYLHTLASAYGLSKDQVNSIHDQLGVQRLY